LKGSQLSFSLGMIINLIELVFQSKKHIPLFTSIILSSKSERVITRHPLIIL